MARKTFICSLLISLTGLSFGTAAAQTVAPMEKKITSFADNFIVQVQIRNPYKSSQISEIEVFDKNWKPVDGAILSKRKTLLGSGHSLTITALVPFNGAKETYVYLCHAITPGSKGRGTSYRGEVCGKYTARRLSV